jgi:uncharacterized protein YprB with RNaseH-like and TPR domain
MNYLFNLLNISKNKKILPSYISATEFENVTQQDFLCDWLSIVLPKSPNPHPLQSLFLKGIQYEAYIIDTIRKKLKLPLLKLSSLSTSREYTSFEHTLDLKQSIDSMKSGEKIIYSPYIASEKEELRGIPDLLIRSDYIESFCGIEVPQESSLFGNYYYIPIEIKYSSLHFDNSEKTLLNINRTKIYKTQLCIYSKILADLQGVFPCCAFIIGKNGFEKIGHVYFQTKDNDIVSLFYKGIEWLRDVRKNAYTMEFSHQLLPNMKVSHPLYDKEKKIVAEYYGEITEFWQCSIKHRYNLLDNTDDLVYSWKDPNFDANLLCLPNTYFQKLDILFKINRGEIQPIYPRKISLNLFEWKSIENECFVDFETVGDIDDNENSTIFLIGIYYKNKYTYFLADTLKHEKNILISFYQFWKDIGSPKIWYWYAEDSFWKKACKKYDLELNMKWVDLYKVFFENNICVKGCKNFKLKSYIYALLSLGKIKINLPPEECSNGINALLLGSEYYENKNKDILQPILVYNEFDCKSLEVLLDFIRKL